MNPKAIELVKAFEGLRLHVYKDIAGLPTVGYGHLVTPGDHLTVGEAITQARADELLEHDMQQAATAVATLVSVPLNENQQAALISLVFNIGVGAFKHSKSVLKNLNNGLYNAAAEGFLDWDHAGGTISSGLRTRRLRERNVFLTAVLS